MLKKRERLTTQEFDRYFTSGKRIHHTLFTLVYTPHEEFHGAVVVGKKVSKKAVERNRIRRRAYNALYTLSREHNLCGVFIILTKAPIIDVTFSEIKEALNEVVGRLTKKR